MVKSLRKTLLLWLLAPLLILFSVGTVIVYQLALNYSEDAYDRALFESAHDIEQLARESINKTGRLELPNVARDILLADRYDKTYFSILDQANTLIAGDGKLVAPPDDADRDDDGSITYDTVIEGEEVRAIQTELHLEVAGQPRIWQILVGETRHKRNGLAKDILTGFVVPQALVIMTAAILVMLGVRRGLTPLEDLRASLAKRAHNDMRPLDTPGVPVEVRPLLEEINNLLSRLQSVLEAQKRFTADAAHQLRTPLAGLSAQTDFAREQPNPPQTQHALDQIKEVSTRLNHAVSQLLSLARNEPGAEKSLRLDDIDLNTLARETTLEWVERAVEHGIDLGFEGTDTAVTISGDPSRLKEMLDNLVDNALRYCPRGSSVTVRVGSNRTLCVEDNGPGIPEEDRDKVFERFHRLLGNEAEGNGLGLAIVREIAEMHGGTVQVTEGTNGRGALFRVCFPATK
jgi:two-component system sensor histidine kinase TctE